MATWKKITIYIFFFKVFSIKLAQSFELIWKKLQVTDKKMLGRFSQFRQLVNLRLKIGHPGKLVSNELP